MIVQHAAAAASVPIMDDDNNRRKENSGGDTKNREKDIGDRKRMGERETGKERKKVYIVESILHLA